MPSPKINLPGARDLRMSLLSKRVERQYQVNSTKTKAKAMTPIGVDSKPIGPLAGTLFSGGGSLFASGPLTPRQTNQLTNQSHGDKPNSGCFVLVAYPLIFHIWRGLSWSLSPKSNGFGARSADVL